MYFEPRVKAAGKGWYLAKKLLRVMKLTAILITIACLHVSAKLHSQITISEKNVTITKVLNMIHVQSGYHLFYKSEIEPDLNNKISVSFSKATLDDALRQVLSTTSLKFRLVDKTIVITKESVKNLVTQSLLSPTAIFRQQDMVLKGKVYGDKNEPLSGATVTLKRTGKNTITDVKGDFEIEDVEPDDIISASFIGYDSKSIKVTDKSYVEIFLPATNNELDEVVMQGYGTTSKRIATGSISTVTAKDIENQPVMNPMLALQGQVPGLVITPTSGYASSPIKILLRGRSNIDPRVSSDPLILIDGMPLNNININNTDQSNGSNILPVLTAYQLANSPSGGESPLFGINPRDIESITVLKDADATAIYGSRGANGVILITTKRSKAGATQFSVNMNEGISKVTRHIDMMNTTQYIRMREEALRNDGIALSDESAPDLLLWDTTRNVDWQKELWGGTGKVTSVNVGVSGGDNNTSFRLNGSYNRQTSILSVSGGARSANLSLSLEHHTADQKFSVQLSTLYTYSFTNEVTQTAMATTLTPNTPAMYNENGAPNYAPWDLVAGLSGSTTYPFGGLLQPSKSSTNSLNSNLELKYHPAKGLTLSTNFGYNYRMNTSSALMPIASQNPALNPLGSATFTGTNAGGWSVEPQIDYATYIGPGKLSVLVGAEVQSSYSRYNVEHGINYTNDFLLNSILNAPIQTAYDGYGQYKYASLLSRINYDIKDKYILNVNGRRDGSSRFAQDYGYGNFGSVGAGWIVSEEKWFQRAIPEFVNFFKFRGSYGVTGSDGVADYQYLSQYSSGSINSLYPGYGNVGRPLISLHAVNPDFHWQSTKEWDEAVDIGFLKDSHLSLTIEHYQNRCDNQLLQYPTPLFTGFANVTANWPATVQNSGWEISVTDSKLVHTKDFNWSATFNISFNRNKLAAYPNIEFSSYYSKLLVGKSLNEVYLYHYLGVDPLTGQYTVEDHNHDGQISTTGSSTLPPLSGSSDQYIARDLAPRFTGGATMSFSYKSFSLSLLFDFVNQWGPNPFLGITQSLPGMALSNQPAILMGQEWQKPGDNAKYAKFSTGLGISATQASMGNIDYSYSDGYYTDASFFRLNNAAFSYAMPAKLAKKMGMTGLNIFINAQNIFVLTKYKGVDPEIQSVSVMPEARIFTGGISFNF